MKKKSLKHVQSKIISLKDLSIALNIAPILPVPSASNPRKKLKLVFTNGCFDLIHQGHIEYLAKAKDMGDLLVVGLNSDASVRRLKGKTRPIQNQKSRAMVLAALEFVDFVVIFKEDTPINVIETLRPDVLVKGGDYDRSTIVGADFVESYGGEVAVIPLVPGHSTTNLVEKINQQEK